MTMAMISEPMIPPMTGGMRKSLMARLCSSGMLNSSMALSLQRVAGRDVAHERAQRVARHAHSHAVDADELLATAAGVSERTLAQPVVPAAVELDERRAQGAGESLFVFHGSSEIFV